MTLTALSTCCKPLPATFPVPIAVVQHVAPNHESLVADILNRRNSSSTPTPARDVQRARTLFSLVPTDVGRPIQDLNSANSFLESILTGVRSGVVVLDRDLQVILLMEEQAVERTH